MGYLDFISDSDYEEYKRRRDKRRLGYDAGEVDENWRAAVAGMRAPVRLPAPPVVTQPTIPLPPQGPTVSSGWAPPQEPGYEPPAWRGPVTSTPPSDPTWLSAIGKRDVTPFTADMGTSMEPTIPIPGSLADTISLPTIKAPIAPDGQLPPWSRATLGSVYEDVDRSALRPFRGLATEAFEPDQQGRYQFPPAKAIGDVATGLREPARIPEWWQGLAERQQGREERGEPYIPIDPSWLGLGEYKALAQMVKPAITKTGKAATVVGQAAKRVAPKVDAALRSPVLERLVPGGTIEDVSQGYPNVAAAIDKEASRINAINERQSARTGRPFGAEMEQRQWELWGLIKRNDDAIAAGQPPILHPDRVNEIGKELGAIEAYKRQEATRPSITYPNVTARPAIPRAEDVTPESLKRWEEPPRRPEGQPSAPSGMQYPNVGDLRRQRHYAEAGFNITKEPEPLGWHLWGPKGGLLGSYPSRREADAALRRIAKQRGIGEEAATYAPAAKRYYHGTGSAFESPDAAKFDPNGLFGPVYNMTDNPEVAGSYAATRGIERSGFYTRNDNYVASNAQELEEKLLQARADMDWVRQNRPEALPELEQWIRDLEQARRLGPGRTTGPNIRAIDVPQNLRLLDADGPIDNALTSWIRNRLPLELTAQFDQTLDWMQRYNRMDETAPTMTELHAALKQTIGVAEANKMIQAAGYDGIRYAGGKRVPMHDAAGVPIEHDAVVIFPESLSKIKNAISGLPMGSPPEAGGSVVGAVTGAVTADEDATPQEVAQRVLLGAAGGYAVGGGLRAAGRTLASKGKIGPFSERLGLQSDADRFLDDVSRRADEIDARLAEIEPQLERGLFAQEQRAARREVGGTIERPSFAGKLTNEQLEDIAAEAGVSPHEKAWWERVDRAAFRERGPGRRSGKHKLVESMPKSELDALDKEWMALSKEKRRLTEDFERRYEEELAKTPASGESSLSTAASTGGTPRTGGETLPGARPETVPSSIPPESIVPPGAARRSALPRSPDDLTLAPQEAAIKQPGAEQEAMFAASEPGVRREFPRGAKPAEPVRQADLLGGEQFEDEATRALFEREQALKAGQQELAAAKQPWEMTKTEFGPFISREIKSTLVFGDVSAPATRNQEQYNFAALKKRLSIPDLQFTDDWNPDRRHKIIVERALAEGRPVPDAVLADYPDLAAKYGKAAEPTVGKAGPVESPVKPTVAEAPLAAPVPAEAVPSTVGQAQRLVEEAPIPVKAPTVGKRFDAGKKLTAEQRKAVVRSIVDVYKAKHAPRVLKGIDRSGEEIIGYEYSPDLFEKSDITGKGVRYYITLPDGRRAHPSELYPELTDARIANAIEEERLVAKRLAEEDADLQRRRDARVAPADLGEGQKIDANRRYNSTGRLVSYSYFAQDKNGAIVRVDGMSKRDVDYYTSKDFTPITEPVKPQTKDVARIRDIIETNINDTPPEVLADYPDLAARYGKVAEPSVGKAGPVELPPELPSMAPTTIATDVRQADLLGGDGKTVKEAVPAAFTFDGLMTRLNAATTSDELAALDREIEDNYDAFKSGLDYEQRQDFNDAFSTRNTGLKAAEARSADELAFLEKKRQGLDWQRLRAEAIENAGTNDYTASARQAAHKERRRLEGEIAELNQQIIRRKAQITESAAAKAAAPELPVKPTVADAPTAAPEVAVGPPTQIVSDVPEQMAAPATTAPPPTVAKPLRATEPPAPTLPPIDQRPPPPPTGPPGTAVTPPAKPDSWLPTVKSTKNILNAAYHPDWVRRLTDRLTGVWSKVGDVAQVAGEPKRDIFTQGAILREAINSDWKSAIVGAMARLRQQGDSTQLFAVDKNGLAHIGKRKAAINDVLEYPNRYRLTPEQKKYAKTIHKLYDDQVDTLAAEGIDVNQLSFEEGGHYVGRRVLGKVGADGDIEIAKVGGRGQTVGGKAGFEKARSFETEGEALRQGFRYLTPEEALNTNLMAAGRKIADQRMADFILRQIPYRTASAPEALKVARDYAKDRLAILAKLKVVINRGYRGERVPPATIASIGKFFPDQARILIEGGITRQEVVPTRAVFQQVEADLPGLKLSAQRDYYRAQNAVSGALGKARASRYGEGTVMAPAFQGKFFSAEDARKLNHILDLERPSPIRGVAESISWVNALPRLLMTTFDIGPAMIQGMITLFSHPNVWGKSFGRSMQALVSEKGSQSFLATHADTIRKWSQDGAIFSPSEFTAAIGQGGILSNVPVARKAVQPFARSFETFLNATRIYGLESMEHLAKTPADRVGLAKFWNEMTGVVDTGKMGLSATQRALETAILFAPRYRRSMAALMTDIAKGGLRGKEARDALGKTLLVGLSGYMGVWGIANRFDPANNPAPHLDPREGGKFLTINVAGQNIGFGGAFYGTTRAMLQMALNPDQAAEIASKYARGLLSPTVSTAVEAYQYPWNFNDTLKLTKKVIGENLLPIWLQSALLEEGDESQKTVGLLGELVGLRTFPERPPKAPARNFAYPGTNVPKPFVPKPAIPTFAYPGVRR